MLLKEWERLPQNIRKEAVKPYYNSLKSKTCSLILKRIFDIVFSVLFIIIFSPLYIVLTLAVAIDSGFPVIYKQKRITTNGKEFYVFKYRTMVKNADKIGSLVTVDNDPRITRVGKFLRKFRLDELPQIFNILGGSMTFVGTRPEVEKYVSKYTDEMIATLLLPAGVTSPASILFKDEAVLLDASNNPDETYINEILPQKMKHNLEYISTFSIINDIKIIFKTIFEVFK